MGYHAAMQMSVGDSGSRSVSDRQVGQSMDDKSSGDGQAAAARRRIECEIGLALRDMLFRSADLLREIEPAPVTTVARVGFENDTYCLVRVASSQRQQALTEKQKQVALLVAQGLPNKEIARRLGVSTATIASHLVRIFRKLAVDSRAALASKLFLLG